MYGGKGSLGKELEKFFNGIAAQIGMKYTIRPMGPSSNVLGRSYACCEALEDFRIFTTPNIEFIPSGHLRLVRHRIKNYYTGQNMKPAKRTGAYSRIFADDKNRIILNMTPLGQEIRITVFRETEQEMPVPRQEKEPEPFFVLMPERQEYKTPIQ